MSSQDTVEEVTAAQESKLAHSSNNGGPPEGGQKPFKIAHRWKVVGMMALAFVLCNMDKVNMSVAVIPMAEELGWSATDRGLVSSAFFWGYSLTQIPAGYVSTKIGGARVLTAGVVLWSLGTLVAPPLAHMSLLALCVSRVIVGLGEGLAPSSATNVMARLIPEGERSRAVTTVFGGLDVGSAVGLVLCGPLIRHYGWPSVFHLFAALGLVWAAIWPQIRPDSPDPDLPTAQQPQQQQSSNQGKQSVPWGRFMTSSAVWAVITAHFCFNWGYYTLLAWLPSYFELALGLNVEKSSLLTLIPYIAMTAMTPVVGPVADTLVNKGWTVTSVRKLAQGIAFAGPAVCMLACAWLTPAGASHTAASLGSSVPIGIIVALLSVSFALGAWSRAGLYCNHQDLSPKYAGALLGITNTAGAFPGILGVTAVGFLLDRTNSWADALFLPTAACQLLGLVVYTALASSKRVDFDAAK
jgi:ACS family sodium-dependent inorganic phosphate cotransporter